MGFAKFSVDSDVTGDSIVKVNDVDVSSQVSGIEFHAQQGKPPLLVLHHLAATGPIEGEGIVHVVTVDVTQEILKWLSAVSPAELEKVVLQRSGWGGESTMATALSVLKEWAGGS